MNRANSDKKSGDDHQRGGVMSSHPPDLNNAHVTNAEKLEKDLKSEHEPVEQHRSSRRPRQRRASGSN